MDLVTTPPPKPTKADDSRTTLDNTPNLDTSAPEYNDDAEMENDASLFGDSAEMPSPIKSDQKEDWAWADEW